MSDLDELRSLTDQVRPPSLDVLRAAARRRDRRTALTLTAGATAAAVAVAGLVSARDDTNHTADPVDPAPETQMVVAADYTADQVHRFETIQVDNTGEHATDTDLTVSAELFEGSAWSYWCTGRPDLSYVVHVTRRDELDWTAQVGLWRAGGRCDGSDGLAEEGWSGDGPPEGPRSSRSSQAMRFNPMPGDEGEPITVRIVLTEAIPGSVASCFGLPAGASPAQCQDESAVRPVADAQGATFGAAVLTRPVEYVATVAGVPVQAQAGDEDGEWLFAGAAQSLPVHDEVTLETDTSGFVYVVQSDPVGRADCTAAYERAVANGDQWHFQGDSENWGCEMKEAELRLLLDGQPVTGAQSFRRDWFDFGAVAVDDGHHVITVERVGGSRRVEFGLVAFQEGS